MVFALFLFFAPNYLGHPDNYIPANPLVTPAHIVPEWYFLPYYAILRAIPDKLLGVIAMFASILVLFVLPWLDTSKVRSATFRPAYKGMFWIFIVNFLVLGVVGANAPEGVWIIIGRVTTAIYFLFFIILPLVGWFERPKPLPDSISSAVLAKSHGAKSHGAKSNDGSSGGGSSGGGGAPDGAAAKAEERG
jgi:quinol-cytochrome oxidoreductase complex cytochrome b subunit